MVMNTNTKAVNMEKRTKPGYRVTWETASIDQDGQKIIILFPVYANAKPIENKHL